MLSEITPPAGEPLTLTEAKDHLRIDHDDDDIYIDGLIKAARQFVEKRTGIVCLTSTWALYLDKWPASGLIYLKKKPVTEISSVEYYATDEASEYSALAGTDYETDVISEPARVRISDAPSLGDLLNAVKVTFDVGYADTGSIPENIKQAILILIGHMYENRQEEITGRTISYLGKGFEYLLSNDELLTA